MMREIKFRAWDGTKMYEPILADGKVFRDGRDYEDYNDAPYDIVIQYTGLKDKNETEIYEGDIVHVVNMLTTAPGTEPYDTVIEWDKYRWSMRRLGEIFTMTHLGPFPLNNLDPFGLDLEVIGNRFENPEMIQS